MSDIRPADPKPRSGSGSPDERPARHVLGLEDRAETRTPHRFREGVFDRPGPLFADDRSRLSRR